MRAGVLLGFAMWLVLVVFLFLIFRLPLAHGAEQAPRFAEQYQPRGEAKPPVHKPRRVCTTENGQTSCRDI